MRTVVMRISVWGSSLSNSAFTAEACHISTASVVPQSQRDIRCSRPHCGPSLRGWDTFKLNHMQQHGQ